MKIYDLSNVSHLEYDLNEIFNRIDSIYDIKFLTNKSTINSRMVLDKNVFWASPESAESFNSKIPQFKSLLKDMYALVEATLRNKGLFNPKQLETKFKYFKEFRLLNNQFKHFENRKVRIDLISTNILGGPNTPTRKSFVNIDMRTVDWMQFHSANLCCCSLRYWNLIEQ